jgi:pimeloyl-ACP methyl ester carboxylesterase
MKNGLVLFFAVLLACGCDEIAGTDKKTDPAIRRTGEVVSGETKIHYVEQGAGDTTLLLVHGWAIDGSYWNNQLNYFSRTYRVIAVDLPGFGQSTAARKDWSLENNSADLVTVISKLDLKNVILVGHSMSGDVALETALKNDPAVIGIIGIDNFKSVGETFTPEVMGEINHFLDSMEQNFRTVAPAYAEKALFDPSTPDSVKTRVKNDIAENDPKIAMSSVHSQVKYGLQEAEKLQNLNYKLYLINCDPQPTDTMQLRINCKSSYEIAYMHATGHYPMIEKPDEFNRLLEQVIHKIGKGK